MRLCWRSQLCLHSTHLWVYFSGFLGILRPPPSSILASPLMCSGFTDVTKELFFHGCAMCSSTDGPDWVEVGEPFSLGLSIATALITVPKIPQWVSYMGNWDDFCSLFPPKTSYFRTLISRQIKRTFLSTWAKHPTAMTLSLLWAVNSC